MERLLFTAYGHAVVIPDGADVQVQIGFTFDGQFYRTAVKCRKKVTESLDIVDENGVHLARININSGPFPSVEVFSDLRHAVEVNQQGRILGFTEVPTPPDTTTIVNITR